MNNTSISDVNSEATYVRTVNKLNRANFWNIVLLALTTAAAISVLFFESFSLASYILISITVLSVLALFCNMSNADKLKKLANKIRED